MKHDDALTVYVAAVLTGSKARWRVTRSSIQEDDKKTTK